jgi:hypothetical protein
MCGTESLPLFVSVSPSSRHLPSPFLPSRFFPSFIRVFPFPPYSPPSLVGHNASTAIITRQPYALLATSLPPFYSTNIPFLFRIPLTFPHPWTNDPSNATIIWQLHHTVHSLVSFSVLIYPLRVWYKATTRSFPLHPCYSSLSTTYRSELDSVGRTRCI